MHRCSRINYKFLFCYETHDQVKCDMQCDMVPGGENNRSTRRKKQWMSRHYQVIGRGPWCTIVVHVSRIVLIIKKYGTYEQVLCDMMQGDGNTEPRRRKINTGLSELHQVIERWPWCTVCCAHLSNCAHGST